MRDDGVGIRAAEALRRRELGPHVSVHEQTEMDFTIIQEVQGASKVIIIDALRGGKEPGAVTKYRFNLRKDDLSELPSLHSLQLSEILDLAAKAEILKCPVIIIGVEPKDDTLGEQMSSEVQSALPKVLDSVAGELSET
jgi:hydrogenase maturation protease